MKKQFDLLKDNEKTLFFRYLTPSLLGMIMLSGYVFVDALCIGRSLGGAGLAALAASTPAVSIFYATGFLFATGGATIYSICNGKGEKQEAKQIYSFAFSLAIFVSIVYAILGFIFVDNIAYFFGATENNLAMTKDYLLTIIVAAPFFVIDIFMNVFTRNDKSPHICMIATIACCSANVVLDVLFVFGFGWGMFGAAFATAISAVASVAITFGHSLKKSSGLHLVKFKPQFQNLKRITANGVSSFISELSNGIVTIAFNRVILSQIGESGVSAYGIIANLNLIFFSIFMGVAQAMQPVVSINYGASKKTRMFNIFRYSVRFSTIAGLLFAATCFLFPEALCAVFISDPVIITLTANALRMYGVAYLLMGINILFDAFFYSVEKPQFAVSVSLSRGLVLVLAVLFCLSNIWGITGVWITVPVTEAITFIIGLSLFLYYRKTTCSKTANPT